MTGNRGTFRPEAIPAAVPPSMRGYFEVAPEPGRPGQWRLWLRGDGSQSKPRSILLTRGDVRRFCAFLYRATEPQEVTPGNGMVSRSQTRSRDGHA